MTSINSPHQRDYPTKPKQIYLYGTCLVDSLFPESGINAVEFLELQGVEVIYPDGQSIYYLLVQY